MSNGELILYTSEDGAARIQLRAEGGKLTDWESVLDGLLRSNELPLLTNAGSVSAAQAERIAFERYESFDTQRREQLVAGEQSDILELEKIAESSKSLSKRGKNEQ